MNRAAVLGAGSWGTAFAKVLADAGCGRDDLGPPREGRRRHPRVRRQPRLPARGASCRSGSPPPPTPTPPSTVPSLVVLAVPSQTLRGNLADWAASPGPGLDPGLADEGHRAGHHQADEPGDRGDRRGRRRTGWWWSPGPTWPPRSPPSSRPRPSSPAPTSTGPRWCSTPSPARTSGRTPTTTWSGCELGGAVKNVIALAYGMATAMGFGDNTKASLITRGLAETARLGVALGADPMTFAGLAGLGDLVATCSSPLSRNRTFGEHLGRGETPGGGADGHPADRRGRQELPGDPRPGPRARRRDADHRAGRAGLPRGRRPAGRGETADEPGDEAGMSAGSFDSPAVGPGDGTRSVHAGLPEPVPGQPFLPGPVFAAPYHLDPVTGPGENGYARTGQPDPARPRGGDRRAGGR